MDLTFIASTISNVYSQNPKVEAVLLGGSVSRNWNDSYSDIELFVFWKESPTEEGLRALLSMKCNKALVIYPI